MSAVVKTYIGRVETWPAGAAGAAGPPGPPGGTIVTINAQTGTAYTLVVGDVGKLVTFAASAATTVTVPANTAAAFVVGSQVTIAQVGTGKVTVAAGPGVAVNATALGLRLRYSSATLVKTAVDTWLLAGDLG